MCRKIKRPPGLLGGPFVCLVRVLVLLSLRLPNRKLALHENHKGQDDNQDKQAGVNHKNLKVYLYAIFMGLSSSNWPDFAHGFCAI